MSLPIGVCGFLPEGGTIPDEFPYGGLQLFRFDLSSKTASIRPGVDVPLAPFYGTIGSAVVGLTSTARRPPGCLAFLGRRFNGPRRFG